MTIKKVRKAVIPAAGLGTRFLPATKSVAKEMLPIVDKPAIQFIVEEAIASGIEDILIITGKAKRSIEDHFDANVELEANLKEKEKLDLLKLVEETKGLNLHFIRQSHPKGLGHAVMHAKSFVGDEPFVVMLGDDLMTDSQPLTKQLIDAYERTSASVVATMKMPRDEIDKYGVIDFDQNGFELAGLKPVKQFVEKPSIEEAPSQSAIIGRYLLTPEIFEILETQQPGAGGEIQLTDAIDTLNKTQRVFAYDFTGQRFDIGDKFGYMKTSIEYGINHPQIGQDLINLIIELGEELKQGEIRGGLK